MHGREILEEEGWEVTDEDWEEGGGLHERVIGVEVWERGPGEGGVHGGWGPEGGGKRREAKKGVRKLTGMGRGDAEDGPG